MIKITHFMRPKGRQKQVELNGAPEETDTMANYCINAGARFTQEVLMNEKVSFACEYATLSAGEMMDIAIEVCDNGPATMPAFEKLVVDAHKVIADDLKQRG